ncbi:MAG TPA: major capsid protein [Syntrophomonadaceae bacterium]|nr:major capsid protein [Syntrophomonadaceae bacterium]
MPLLFPTTQEVSHVVRNRAVDPAQFIGRKFCPVRDYFSKDIEYDVLEASRGMTKAHNIGTDPKVATLAGQSRKRMGTGYWKETYRIGEEELLFARQAGTYNQRAGRDQVLQRSLEMDDRLETRMEWLSWQPLVAGQLDVDENGVKYTVDYSLPQGNKPELLNDDRWSVTAKANPMINLSAWMAIFRGTGARGVEAYFNQTVAGYLAQNSVIQTLLKNTQYAKMLSPDNVSEALKLLFPKLDFTCYDEGYTDDAGNFTPFIPNDRFIIRGQGPVSELMMDFASTITLHNGTLDKPQPGKFAIIEDKSGEGKNPHVDITVGIYGLPRVFHPNWIVSAKVA